MYEAIKTHAAAKLENGVDISPVVTLEDGSGGRAHIWVDDRCYQIGLTQETAGEEDIVRVTTHIFSEAHKALSELPSLDGAKG
jgi:hypothetical protein